MFYSVTLRFKGECDHIETAECTEYEIKEWCEKAKSLWEKTGRVVLAEFKPKEKIFEFGEEEVLINNINISSMANTIDVNNLSDG